MTLLESIIMGLVQGLTEFLPVSSSAHLVFADHFLHLRLSEAETVSFDVLLHLGTLMAVLVFFYKDVLALLRGAGRLFVRPAQAWREDAHSRLFVLLIVGTVPAAILGVTLKDFFSAAFQNVPGTATLLFVTAAMLLWITARQPGARSIEHANWKDALTIGAFQALAILPGISRSGATITGGLLRGLDRDAAPRFSFLLSIPIIAAGGLFDLKDSLHTGFHIPVPMMIAGFTAAAVSGYLAVVMLLGIVRKGRLDRFAYYCIAAGIVMLGYWYALAPKVAPDSIMVKTQSETYFPDKHGEIGPIELGEHVTLEMDVESGVMPVKEVVAIVPITTHHHGENQYMQLEPIAGKRTFILENYHIAPSSDHYSPGAAGEIRDIWVVMRNKWGLRNEVRLRLRIVPESLKSRLA